MTNRPAPLFAGATLVGEEAWWKPSQSGLRPDSSPKGGAKQRPQVALVASKGGSPFPWQTHLPLPLGEVARRSRDGEGPPLGLT